MAHFLLPADPAAVAGLEAGSPACVGPRLSRREPGQRFDPAPPLDFSPIRPIMPHKARRPPISDVLDQSEVDALLAAVDGGQMAHPTEGTPTVFGRTGPQQLDVATYDFKRPERVSKDQ